MKIDGNKATFSSTGREIDANNGIIGLSPDMTVYEGYDDSIYHQPSEYLDEELSDLTTGEQVELAEHMIEQWQRFKDLACAEKQDTDAPKNTCYGAHTLGANIIGSNSGPFGKLPDSKEYDHGSTEVD